MQTTMSHFENITTSEALALQIRTLTLQIFEFFNHKNPADPVLQYLAPDFTSTSEEDDADARQCIGFPEHMEKHIRMLAANPSYRFTPIDCTVELKDSNRQALVILSAVSNTTTFGENLRVEFMSVIKWQLWAKLGWVMCSSRSIRGMVSGMGFV